MAVLVLVAAGLLAAAPGDWTIPTGAPELVSPVATTATVLARGAELFRSNCATCHGREGKGGGPSAEPRHPPADLTDPRVAAQPEGVLFYKVWNGKTPMPAFKSRMTANEVWTVVAYVRTLGLPRNSASNP
jgi:mono/diheme cytochrome c family protein